MKILYINFSKGFGGLEIISYKFFEYLLEKNFDIIFLVQKNSKLHERLLQSNFKERIIPLTTIKYFDIINFFKIYHIIKKNDVKIIHTFKSSDIWFSVISAKILFKLKNVRIVHYLQLGGKKSRKDFLHSCIYKYLDKLLTITNQMSEDVNKNWPVKKEIIQRLYPGGINLEEYNRDKFDTDSVKLKYKISANKKILAIIGQITEGKGQLFVLKSFKYILQYHPELFLIIAGAPPKNEEYYLNEVLEYININNLQNKVSIVGFCNNVPELLSIVDIFILGSKEESFGIVVIEAMAAGCITVASNAGGIPEIITENQNGFLYETFDNESLNKVLLKVLQIDDDTKKQIIKNARETICSKFSKDILVNQLIEIYNNLAGECKKNQV